MVKMNTEKQPNCIDKFVEKTNMQLSNFDGFFYQLPNWIFHMAYTHRSARDWTLRKDHKAVVPLAQTRRINLRDTPVSMGIR